LAVLHAVIFKFGLLAPGFWLYDLLTLLKERVMERVEKAVILARGLGTRMRKQDDSAVLDRKQTAVAGLGVKAMIPIGRPFLDYALSALADAGYSRVCLVIGPEHQMVRDYYSQSPPRRVQLEFAVQEKPLGTADAVLAAKEFAGEDLFLMLNSDNYYPLRTLRSMRDLRQSGIALFEREPLIALSNIPEERVLKFAVAKIGGDGRLERIYEKPDEETMRKIGIPIYVSMNCWVFSPSIFQACASISLSKRGELELSDAVQYAIDKLNETFQVLTFQDSVLDLSSRSDIAAVAERLQGIHPNP
jgi:dTDP-glucose pyrophosphorylase